MTDDCPDPTELLFAESAAWAEYRGRKDAADEARQRWRDTIAALDQERRTQAD